ncbi:GNAT family N-acetyltransferase [Brucella tritici]|uniref:GNAT family N-acetyltransferase n=1 Tax=Brucella tritici TaxID=94626 RepID=UPI0015921E9F|nr:GNAT family N-acetyltransferase [Brucella tritici]
MKEKALKLSRLSSLTPLILRKEIRAFCLRIIKEQYAIEYNEKWHADLDSLLLSNDLNWFSTPNRGRFYTASCGETGKIIAAGGLYDLSYKPTTQSRLQTRYEYTAPVCQIVRVYLDSSYRRRGIGRQIVKALEADAYELGYHQCYLHADAEATNTLRFWRALGYKDFGRFSYLAGSRVDTCVDFDKQI